MNTPQSKDLGGGSTSFSLCATVRSLETGELADDTPPFSVEDVWILGRKTLQVMIEREWMNVTTGKILIVVSQQKHHVPGSGYWTATCLADALQLGRLLSPSSSISVVGGETLFSEALGHFECQDIRIRLLSASSESSTYLFFPLWKELFRPLLLEDEDESPPNPLQRWAKGVVLVPNGFSQHFHHFTQLYYRFFVPPTSQQNWPLPFPTGKEYQQNLRRQLRRDVHMLQTLTQQRPQPTSSNPEEEQYLAAIRRILAEGEVREDRTGTGTISIFGDIHFSFSLEEGRFPLLTTKRTFFRGVVEELLWFVSGDTNAKTLQEKKVHIWDGNGSRAFLDQRGLHDREEGDLGPIYGFQWRHFGADYETCHSEYQGKGIDQLAEVIHKLRTNPTDRRLVVSAWNPTDLPLMALPPCHVLFQFYVSHGTHLHCKMYQRSADMGLGVPMNIASYALLTCMVAKVVGLKPGKLFLTFGDAHIYTNHKEALMTQCEREPYAFPTLRIARETIDSIDDFQATDFQLEEYQCHPTLKMSMAV